MKQFRKKATQFIIAVQLNLETEGFNYVLWGGPQACKKGDWIVNNNGETYTIDAESFANTYVSLGDGKFAKRAVVFAEQQSVAGSVETKEGVTSYEAGDFVVYNNSNKTDGYAVEQAVFVNMYEPVE